MSLRSTISLSALSLALAATPGFADVTGAQVWENWKSYMDDFGYSTDGTESTSGDTLTVSDIVMSFNVPQDDATFAINMGTISFTDTGSGSVSVTFPAEMPITFDVTDEDENPVKGTIVYTQAAPTMIVSGEENDLTYTYAADSVGVRLTELEIEGSPMARDMFDISASLTDMANITRMTTGEKRDFSQTTTASAVTYTMKIDIPEGPDKGTVSFSGGIEGLKSEATGSLPKDFDANDPAAMMNGDFAVASAFSYTSGNSVLDAVTPDGPFAAQTSSDGGTLNSSFGEAGLLYDVTQNNLVIDAQKVPNFPFPVNVTLAKTAFNLAFPLQASEEEQDFAFGFTLGDFSISDVIWNLFDPAEQLSRDPATLALDLDGKAKVLTNFFDPEEAANLGDTAPGELNALNINKILLSAVGAELSGTGAFTFDNADTTTFDGMPKPTGALDIQLQGANKVLDTLVQMGLLPNEQAMGARMMMGMFGVSQGEDLLSSKIEVNEQGHVLANGQRLR